MKISFFFESQGAQNAHVERGIIQCLLSADYAYDYFAIKDWPFDALSVQENLQINYVAKFRPILANIWGVFTLI